MSTNDSEIHEWGMAFISRVDEIINAMDEDEPTNPEEESVKEAWLEGDANLVLSAITLHDFLTDEQMEWVTQFLSEI